MNYSEYENAVNTVRCAHMTFRTIYCKIDADANGIAALLGDEVLQALIPGPHLMGVLCWPKSGNSAERVFHTEIPQPMAEKDWMETDMDHQLHLRMELTEWGANMTLAAEILWDAHIDNIDRKNNDEED